MDSLVEVGSKVFAKLRGETMKATLPETPEARLNRALELIGGSIDPEIAESYSSLEERILAQALENVELAERRLREIQKLVGDLSEALA
jgi:hypothetical protein